MLPAPNLTLPITQRSLVLYEL